MRIKCHKRNQVLLYCANNEFTVRQTNRYLEERMMEDVCEEEWNIWINYFKPLAAECPIYEKEILYNDRPLTWFARDLKKRHKKDIIS